jgi:hypothetical protein
MWLQINQTADLREAFIHVSIPVFWRAQSVTCTCVSSDIFFKNNFLTPIVLLEKRAYSALIKIWPRLGQFVPRRKRFPSQSSLVASDRKKADANTAICTTYIIISYLGTTSPIVFQSSTRSSEAMVI